MTVAIAWFGVSIATASTISLKAHADSRLDWPFVTSGPVQAQWTWDRSYSYAGAFNPGETDKRQDPSPYNPIPYIDTSTSARVTGATSSARTTVDSLSAISDSFRGGPDGWVSDSTSGGERIISLTALSSGVLRLAFFYHSSISVSTEGRASQSAHAGSYFELYLQKKGWNVLSQFMLKDLHTGNNAGVEANIFDQDAPYSVSFTSTGYFDIPVTSGSEYKMWFRSIAWTRVYSATVPEPGTVSLAITSITILVLARHYRRRDGQRIRNTT